MQRKGTVAPTLPVRRLKTHGTKKETVMKRITAFALFTIAGLLAAGNALAQQHEVQATVPFNFTVGGKVLPSGTYTINRISDNGIEIRSREQHVAVLASAFATVEQSNNGDELVFERHADLYSLREILCEPQAMNLSLPAEHWKKGSRMEEAMNSDSDGLVLVAVNK
jgi:hypothetical protein